MENVNNLFLSLISKGSQYNGKVKKKKKKKKKKRKKTKEGESFCSHGKTTPTGVNY